MAAPEAAKPAPKIFKVAAFPAKILPCEFNCGAAIANNEILHRVGLGLNNAEGIDILFTTGRTKGKDLDDPALGEDKVWQAGNNPDPDLNLAVRKSKELDVDGVVMVKVRWDQTEVRGFLYFVDARISRTRMYEFSVYRVGTLNLDAAINRAVADLTSDASKVIGRQTVAVLELETEQADPGAAIALGESLREELRKSERYTVMESSEMAAALDKLAPGRTLCTAVECALEAGKLLQVDKVVAGRVTGISTNTWKVSAIQVDVATGETITSDSVRHTGTLGNAGRSMAVLAQELAVTASPDGVNFRAEQRKWRWKTGLLYGGAALMFLTSGYLSGELEESNERQKDLSIQAGEAATSSEYDRFVKKLDNEKATGKDLRNQAILAQLAAGLLVWWGWSTHGSPPELPPVAWQVEPVPISDGGPGIALSYRW